MENIAEITDYQAKINKLMLEYEGISRKLLECTIDEIPVLIKNREDLSVSITAMSDRINVLCSEDETGMALSAYKNSCLRSELSDELKQIFDLRQEFNSIAFRIKNLNYEITGRIELEKNKLLEKIIENNNGQNAKAAKYLNGGMTTGKNIYFPKNKKLI
ncbi:MAG: hypothetical protein ACI4I9_00470 [Porcipelethomonas sp.]